MASLTVSFSPKYCARSTNVFTQTKLTTGQLHQIYIESIYIFLTQLLPVLWLYNRTPPPIETQNLFNTNAVSQPIYPANAFILQGAFLLFFFFLRVKVHHTNHVKPLESASPGNAQKGFRQGKGGVQSPPLCSLCKLCHILSHIVWIRWVMAKTAQSDWRCGRHSNADVGQASFTGASGSGRHWKETARNCLIRIHLQSCQPAA